MKKYENDKIIEIVCNKCGRKIPVERDITREGVWSVNINWGYFSQKDGERHQFDLCETCYDSFVKGFAVPIQIRQETELI
jgi:hypothetical protein